MKSISHDAREKRLLVLAVPGIALTVGALALLASEASALVWVLVPAAMLLGLRHAFDADHIASINDVIFRLRAQHKPANWVGTFFSFGHSTVVMIAAITVGAAGMVLSDDATATATTVSTLFVALFLTVVCFLNVRVLVLGGSRAKPQGILSVLGRRWLAGITDQRQMLLVGFIFGLGLDTAVSLLALLAGVITLGNLSILVATAIVLFFVAGMSAGDGVSSLLVNALHDKAAKSSPDTATTSVYRYMAAALAILSGAVAFYLWLQFLPYSWISEPEILGYSGMMLMAGILVTYIIIRARKSVT